MNHHSLFEALVPPGPKKIGEDVFEFTVWSPNTNRVDLELLEPSRDLCSMQRDARGYWRTTKNNVRHGSRYRFLLDGSISRPDPASNQQPEGVHGPSALVDHDRFVWENEEFHPVPWRETILYEIHVGTFTPEGTFDAAAERLDHLVRLGVTAVEVMPVARFPGNRNWGYDGVYPFAVQDSYGGPEGFKRFVSRCHHKGLSVFLDVVYNHLGPEGNYFRDFGPYFSSDYATPWGEAVNFDGPHSDEVRNFFLCNALHWFDRYHVDGLRLDATHAILDRRPVHFLRELALITREYERRTGRKRFLVAETNLNDPALAMPHEIGGKGLDALWNDDFHHAVHTRLTGERSGYYEDYGDLEFLSRSLSQGFAYQGEFSRFRLRSHGAQGVGLPATAFVNALQTHDQVGNRVFGERLSSLTSLEGLKLGAALLLLAPYVPLLFMGEEYGEDRPFLYFVSHGDPELVEAVRRGRREEFKEFRWSQEPPDPQAPDTFERCILDWESRDSGDHGRLLNFYRKLIGLRKRHPALAGSEDKPYRVWTLAGDDVLAMERRSGRYSALCIFSFSAVNQEIERRLFIAKRKWDMILNSADLEWGGPGGVTPCENTDRITLPALGVIVFSSEEERR